MRHYDSFTEIIQIWGKPTELAKNLNDVLESEEFKNLFPHKKNLKKVPDAKVRLWKHRDRIPAAYWPAVQLAAEKIGERKITVTLMSTIEPGREKKKKEEKEKNTGSAA